MSQTKESFEDYDGFVEKFKPKRTTDDCYTPPDVYDCVRDWACERWGIDPDAIVRPFYPGGDYESYAYPGGAVVLDNPPFSILSRICAFYLDRGIPFFLFAPSLTALSGAAVAMRVNHVICDCSVEYENGAKVRTSFVTSYGYPTVYMTAPDLSRRINRVQDERRRATTRELPRYAYPDHVLTAAMGQRYAKYGIELSVSADECVRISALDAQREAGKGIFGGGLLLCDGKARERAAAERTALRRAEEERMSAAGPDALRWRLSDREMELVGMIGGTR